MTAQKRIYIAGCVTDGGRISEANYKEKFYDASGRIFELGHIPVNPTSLPHNHQRRWQDYMVEALHAMLDCDAVLALPCWKRSIGATIEVQLALRLGKEVIFDSAPTPPVNQSGPVADEANSRNGWGRLKSQ